MQKETKVVHLNIGAEGYMWTVEQSGENKHKAKKYTLKDITSFFTHFIWGFRAVIKNVLMIYVLKRCENTLAQLLISAYVLAQHPCRILFGECCK